MWIWIVVAVVASAVAAWALWSRRKGISDGDVRRQQRDQQAKVEEFRRPDTSGGIGMK
jgi:hypothetical protein